MGIWLGMNFVILIQFVFTPAMLMIRKYFFVVREISKENSLPENAKEDNENYRNTIH